MKDFIEDLRATVIRDGQEAVGNGPNGKEHPQWIVQSLKLALVKPELFPLTCLGPEWKRARSHARATADSSGEDTHHFKSRCPSLQFLRWRGPPLERTLLMFSERPCPLFCRVSNNAFRSGRRHHKSLKIHAYLSLFTVNGIWHLHADGNKSYCGPIKMMYLFQSMTIGIILFRAAESGFCAMLLRKHPTSQ